MITIGTEELPLCVLSCNDYFIRVINDGKLISKTHLEGSPLSLCKIINYNNISNNKIFNKLGNIFYGTDNG